MAFQFRFRPLLELRRRQRDEAGAEVGKALEAIQKIEQQRGAIDAERQKIRELKTNQLIGNVSVDSLLSHGRYGLQLTAEIESLRQTRAQLEHELAKRQEALIAAEAEVKRFERLEERERVAHDALLRKREQAESDDSSGRRYLLSHSNAGLPLGASSDEGDRP